jgi:hypothetical protein
LGLPRELTAYFEYLDRRLPDEAADQHSEATLNARPPADDHEGAPRVVRRGRDTLRELFHARGPRDAHHHVTGWAVRGCDAFLEGVVYDGGDEPTYGFVISARVTDEGIDRFVSFKTTDVTPRHRPSDGAPADASVLEQFGYRLAMGRPDLVELAHPRVEVSVTAWTNGAASRLACRGNAALARPLRPWPGVDDVVVVASATNATELFVELRVESTGGEDYTVVMNGSVARSGTLRRVVALACSPAIPVS